MGRVGLDVEMWARERHAAYEVGPLVEIVQGKPVQVGFTISLFARVPLERASGAARQKEMADIRERLREIVEALALPDGTRAQVLVEAPRAAVILQHGRARPEVGLSAQVFHRHDYFAAVTPIEETRFLSVSGQLSAMGLEERRQLLR